jgi:hypothetical protein
VSALTAKDYEAVLADKRRLTRELDVAMHGEAGAAKQASLCDLIPMAKRMRTERAQLLAALAHVLEVSEGQDPGCPECRDARRLVRRIAANQRGGDNGE